MTEWDKMQEHQIYNDFDADLFNLRVKAKKLFKEFNRTEDEEVERRQEIMHKLFKKVGERVWMEPDLLANSAKILRLEMMSILTSDVAPRLRADNDR